jgi:hypothetical protein
MAGTTCTVPSECDSSPWYATNKGAPSHRAADGDDGEVAEHGRRGRHAAIFAESLSPRGAAGESYVPAPPRVVVAVVAAAVLSCVVSNRASPGVACTLRSHRRVPPSTASRSQRPRRVPLALGVPALTACCAVACVVFRVPTYPKSATTASMIHAALTRKNLMFASLQSTDLQRVVEGMEPCTVTTDTVLIQQGDEADYFFVVSSGMLDVLVDGVKVRVRVCGVAVTHRPVAARRILLHPLRSDAILRYICGFRA